MKLFLLLLIFVLGLAVQSLAQSRTEGLTPAINAPATSFSEWNSVTFKDNGSEVGYDYRIAFLNRKGLACNYEVQVKNTSASTLRVKLKTHYYDALVKRHFGDEFKAKVKAGETASYEIRTQGCKAQKDAVNPSDAERCHNCQFTYELIAEVD